MFIFHTSIHHFSKKGNITATLRYDIAIYRFLFALIKLTETIVIITASVSDAISCPMAAYY